MTGYKHAVFYVVIVRLLAIGRTNVLDTKHCFILIDSSCKIHYTGGEKLYTIQHLR